MKAAMRAPPSAAPVAAQKTIWYAVSVGTCSAPDPMAKEAKTAATIADADEVPIERRRVLRPLAEAVSVIGTARMMRVGIAAKARAVPSEAIPAPIITSTIEP